MLRVLLWILCLLPLGGRGALAQEKGSAPMRLVLIVDEKSGESIAHAVVDTGGQRYLSDLEGRVHLPISLPRESSLYVRALGYKPKTIALASLSSTARGTTIRLTPEVSHLHEVAVERRQVTHSRNMVGKHLSAEEIQKRLGQSFASALQDVKGVSMIQTGATIAKPVLHGMYGNRLLIINNGVRQQGQQWGTDHAPELDANTAGGITVIKGADAVRYGADALGGVIELMPRPLPYAARSLEGSLSLLYGSNGHRGALTGHIGRGMSFDSGQLAWRLQGTYLNAGDRATPLYLLNNTGMREANLSAVIGWTTPRYGIETYYSYYSTQLGVMYSAQMGNVELLKERIAIGEPVDPSPFTRVIDYPHQKVSHHVAKVKGHCLIDDNSRLQMQVAYQSDFRNEHHQRRNYKSHIPSLSLNLHALQSDLKWIRSRSSWRSEVGAFGGFTNNFNTPGTGVVPIIPNYTQINAGLYTIHRYARSQRWGTELGIRADHQDLKAHGIDYDRQTYGGHSRYLNVSYTLGGHYKPWESLEIRSNIGQAWRAPHVHELYSKGLEHASGLYSSGSPSLGAERSTKWVTSLSYDDKRIALRLDAYWQIIRGYIYDEPSGEFFTLISGAYPVFQYKSTDASFRGIDADLRWCISRHWDYEVGGSMIWADELSTGNYLPYIPSGRLAHHLSWRLGRIGAWEGGYIKCSHTYVAKQHRFDPQTDLIPYSPDAYHLVGLEAGVTWQVARGHKLKWLLSADNLLDAVYREYTNRFRYYAHDLGRDVRLMMTWEF